MSITDVFLLVGAYSVLPAVVGCATWAITAVIRAFTQLADTEFEP